MFFYCTSLSKLYASSDIEKIESGLNAVLSNIEIIGDSAFCGCTSLQNIDFGTKMTQIDGQAFRDSGITNVNLPASFNKFSGMAFWGCRDLKRVDLSVSKVENIPGYAFHGCNNLSNVILNDGLQNLEKEAFAGCTSLEMITIPSSVTTLRK